MAARPTYCRSTIYVILSALLLAAGGCRQKMVDMPRYEVYEAGPFFADSLSVRPLVAGTVPRRTWQTDADFFRGTDPYVDTDGTLAAPRGGEAGYEARLVDALPFAVTPRVLARGQQRFEIYCAPCHGLLGDGRGVVVQRGFRAPPSFHTDRLREAPAGHFFSVITSGYGAMFSYADRVAPADRWAIAAYIRALQLSQHATLGDVPPAHLPELLNQAP